MAGGKPSIDARRRLLLPPRDQSRRSHPLRPKHKLQLHRPILVPRLRLLLNRTRHPPRQYHILHPLFTFRLLSYIAIQPLPARHRPLRFPLHTVQLLLRSLQPPHLPTQLHPPQHQPVPPLPLPRLQPPSNHLLLHRLTNLPPSSHPLHLPHPGLLRSPHPIQSPSRSLPPPSPILNVHEPQHPLLLPTSLRLNRYLLHLRNRRVHQRRGISLSHLPLPRHPPIPTVQHLRPDLLKTVFHSTEHLLPSRLLPYNLYQYQLFPRPREQASLPA